MSRIDLFKNAISEKRAVKIIAGIDFGSNARAIQATYIKKEIDKTNYPTIVCGDFNDVGNASCIKIIKENHLKDAWWNCGNGYGNTLNIKGLPFRLDHCLYNPNNFKCVSCDIIKNGISDHHALLIDFKIK